MSTPDLQPIWDGLNTAVPWALMIIGPVLGIALAFKLVKGIGDVFMRAFSSFARD